jgi:hypothetical protein
MKDAPLHLLVAEDHLVNQTVVKALLEALGHRVDIVADGRQAVSAVTRTRYDLVLMDVRMPEMDGLAATRAIRDLPPPAGTIPIVAFTANNDTADIKSCRAAGMNGFLAKPVTSAELAQAIASALDRPMPPVTAAGPRAADAILDRAALERFADDLGRDLLPRMLERIGAEMVRRLTELRTCAGAGERAALQREAHALKGSAATIGLTRLAALAKSLERNAATLEATAICHAIEEIEAAYAAGWMLVTAL